MFCPNCGSEDRQASQFCRVCGGDLRAVRQGLEKPESVMASVNSAREEIGHAIASRIRELRDAGDLKVVEDLLPEVEKFFETPEQKRLRRIRQGVVTAMCGLGGTLFFLFLSFKEHDLLFMIMAGVATFLIGLGIVINGLLFTVPKEQAGGRSKGVGLKEEKEIFLSAANTREELPAAKQLGMPVPSVTEHTTHRLASETAFTPKANPQAKRLE